MDVRHYFEPVDFTKFSGAGPLKWNYTLGAGIEKVMNGYNPDKTNNINIALFGVPFDIRTKDIGSKAPDNIRKELYQLARIDKNMVIADFGNLKTSELLKENYRAVRDLVEYFNDLNITTIILGGSQDLTLGICDAYHNNRLFSLSVVDSSLDIKTTVEPLNANNFLTRIFRQNPEILQFNLIGYQSYFVPSEYFMKTKGISEHLRLGLLREHIELAEPVFRNSDVISFDMDSLQYSSADVWHGNSPNGLRSEEACQLSRYAGIANRVKTFGLFNCETDNEVNTFSYKQASQIIWYFIEGFYNRVSGDVRSAVNNTVYKVEVENVDHPIVFVNNMQTGQWWMEISSINDDKHYFACSEKDYLQAKNNEIPELWLKYVQKTDGILK